MTDKLPLVVDPVLKQIREISAGEQLPAEILANALMLALTGLTTADSGVVTSTDNLLQAIGKVQGQINNKVEKVAGKGLSTNDYTNADLARVATIDAINALLQSDDSALDELQEIVDFVKLNRTDLDALGVDSIAGLRSALDGKQPLSLILTGTTASFTAALKTKLDGIAAQATKNQTDAYLLNRTNHTGTQSASTIAGLATVATSGSYNDLSNKPSIPTLPATVTQSEAEAGTATTVRGWTSQRVRQNVAAYAQPSLISGTNIKTINGESLLGGGDVAIVGAKPSLQGDTAPYANQTRTYQITNYNSFSSYAVSASAGTASISGDTITYTAPVTAGNVSLTLTVDGHPAVFAVNVQAAPSYIPTPTPTPDNFGDPLEGGFYAGMIWNQLAQSATNMTIATGSKTFTVPDMTSAPIVYQGQMVEVRSRANPANKFIGTVTGALGTSLTINVTSIGGSGTFSDWSVMARHRVIVAPKASGEHAGIALKNSNSALPTACQTLTEGFAATQAMRDADSSTVYPAAHWARSLNIGGRTDWYIPARDELELCWRNLKPATNSNYTINNRATAASFNYANNGSYGDTANTHGLNNNSAPTGAAYTAAVPAQTAATAFRTGGTEAYVFDSVRYWSSSEYSATHAWLQHWLSSYPGHQTTLGKTSPDLIRAVRRSVI